MVQEVSLGMKLLQRLEKLLNAALTALGTYLILSPKKAQAASPGTPEGPGTGF